MKESIDREYEELGTQKRVKVNIGFLSVISINMDHYEKIQLKYYTNILKNWINILELYECSISMCLCARRNV